MTEECPNHETLNNFTLGLLPDEAAWPIEAHLSSCARCASRSDSRMPRDGFAALFRVSRAAITVDGPEVETLTHRLRKLVALPASSPRPETASREPGEMFGRYRLLAELGRGGMGIVYRAEDPQLKRTVALKVLLDNRFADPIQCTRFQREAEALAQLHHPAIVSIHEVGTHDGRPFLALEYVPGGTLAHRLRGQPQPIAESVALMVRLVGAVQHAHTLGIVHRDLKPGNVLIGDDLASAKISDFGLARRMDEHGLTETGAILGTPGYLAPEQTVGSGSTVGPTADIYSLGAILYEMLTGRPPFRGENLLETLELARTTDPVAPRRLRSSIPRNLETITLKCLQRDPRKRYTNAADLLADLERFQRGEPIHARRASWPERLTRWTRRNPMATALIVVFLGAAISLAISQRRTQRALDRAEANESRAKDASERANVNYRAARDALEKILSRTSSPGQKEVPGLRSLSRKQREDALEFYLAVAERADDDPAIKQDVAQSRYIAATLQADFGRIDEARANAREAERLFGELVAHDATNPRVRFGYLDAYLFMTMYSEPGVDRGARLRQAITLAEELVSDFPDDPGSHSAQAIVLNNCGYDAYRNKQPDAEKYFRASVAAHEKRLSLTPNDRHAQVATAGALLNLHLVAHQLGRPDVMQLGDRADDLLLKAHRADPSDHFILARLGDHRTNRAYSLFNAGQEARALSSLTEVIDLLEAAHKNEPQFEVLKNALYTTNGARAEVCAALKKNDLCVASWRRVVELAPPDQQVLRRGNLIHALLEAKQPEQALREAEALAKIIESNPNTDGYVTIIVAAAKVQSGQAIAWAHRAKKVLPDWPSCRQRLRANPAMMPLLNQPDWQSLLAE